MGGVATVAVAAVVAVVGLGRRSQEERRGERQRPDHCLHRSLHREPPCASATGICSNRRSRSDALATQALRATAGWRCRRQGAAAVACRGRGYSTQTLTVASSSSMSTSVWPAVERAQDSPSVRWQRSCRGGSRARSDRPVVAEHPHEAERQVDRDAAVLAARLRNDTHVEPLEVAARQRPTRLRRQRLFLGRRARLLHGWSRARRGTWTRLAHRLEVVVGPVGSRGQPRAPRPGSSTPASARISPPTRARPGSARRPCPRPSGSRPAPSS